MYLYYTAEVYFRAATNKYSSKVDDKKMVSQLMKNASVITDLKVIKSKYSDLVKKLNLLEDLVMYVCVHTFSFVKGVSMAHKIKSNYNELKSLQKEIKKQSSSLDYSH